jgi:acyl-[acyl-carrier-protein]-phospholipid O-acyltransferase/long-chain-fatty-acid--[acyl-carrier-protein] ligase
MTRTFKWLNITQAVGALIDNTFKMVTVIYLVTSLNQNLTATLSVTSALLVIPFLLFSNWAGALTDRYSKRTLTLAAKWAELVLLLAAFPALASGLAWPMQAVLFLLAAQSAFFGPVKRGIVPELVAPEDLARANGQMTGTTYLAIILGLFLPSFAVTVLHVNGMIVLAGCVALSVIGLLCAYRLPPTPAANRSSSPSIWIVPDALRAMRSLSPHLWLKRAALGSIVFSGIAALFQQNLVVYARDIASLSVESSGYLFLLVAAGIAFGAWLAGRLSPHAIEVGLIPVGAFGLSLALLGLGWANAWSEMMPLLILAGLAAGLCIVPMTAYLQAQAPAHNRGEIFGAIEFWSFAAMVAASGLFYLLINVLHLGTRTCMFLTGGAGAIAALWSLVRLPEHTARFLLSRLTRLLYRVDVCGLENLPREGGALLVANHIAYGDATIIQSATQRQIRYVMSRDIFASWSWCRPIFRITRAIPIHTSDGPRALVHSLNNAREALLQGSLVGIFPEGELTRTGALQPFHKGFEKIAKGTGCPIIPIHLDNLWGSIFSFRHGEPGLRWPSRLPLHVTVRIGKPLPPTATAEDARLAVAELGVETAVERASRPGNTLTRRFLNQARRCWPRPIARDTLGQSVTYGRLLTGAVALNARLAPQLASECNVGILLPPSVAGLLANTALTLQGKTVVNLNWTVSSDAFRSAVAQSGVRHILTSRRFTEVVALPETSARLIFLEEALAGLTLREKAAALLRARFAPLHMLAFAHVPSPLDAACVIFSSGSTGTPKGIVLSHANLLSNLDALQTVVPVTPRDTLCATLPFFHSFGYLGTIWWPLLTGIPTVFHANPLQAAQVLHLLRDARATTLLTTPTLLQTYLRRSAPGDLANLRHVFTGGEKLPAALTDAFEQATGQRPLEGYGATELSPVVAMGLPNRTVGQTACLGHKPGSAGRPLPNIVLKVVDPDTGTPLPSNTPGLLLVKGPNVMQGYLNNPLKTAEVLRDGWYNTGDIARIDEDGFLFLTDRLSRFSKIGGEMVPHGAIEEALQRACATTEPCVAVIGVPDSSRGEDLAVCYTPQAGDAETLFRALKRSGLPNLWIPSRDNFISVASIPVLGTGKTDLRALRDIVFHARRLCA